jgi:hypothetical protein
MSGLQLYRTTKLPHPSACGAPKLPRGVFTANMTGHVENAGLASCVGQCETYDLDAGPMNVTYRRRLARPRFSDMLGCPRRRSLAPDGFRNKVDVTKTEDAPEGFLYHVDVAALTVPRARISAKCIFASEHYGNDSASKLYPS